MSFLPAKYAEIAGPAAPGEASRLSPADTGDAPRPRKGEREPCVAEAAHYAAMLRDMAARLRTAAERGGRVEIIELAALFDDTALTLEAKDRERPSGVLRSSAAAGGDGTRR